MTAELLRRAAAKIRETAGKATPGPWVVDHDADAQITFPGRRSHKENVLPEVVSYQGIDGGINSASNVEHIALWSPDVALVIADWLDGSASDLEYGGTLSSCDAPGVVQYHIDFARLILGEQP